MIFFKKYLIHIVLLLSSFSVVQAQCNLKPLEEVKFNNNNAESKLVNVFLETPSVSGNCQVRDIEIISKPSWISDRESFVFISKAFHIEPLNDNTTGEDRIGEVVFTLNGSTTTLRVIQTRINTEPEINNTTSESYDITGKVIVSTKSYFDDLGKEIQTQSLDVKTGKVWVTETKYDAQGRAALITSGAPVDEEFGYQESFIKNAAGNIFNEADLGNIHDGNPVTDDPSELGNMEGTLGSYYAENTEEKYQDITTRPYSRTFYDELNPGKTLKTAGGNKVDTTGDGVPDSYPQGFSHTMPAAQELYYAFGKNELNHFDQSVLTLLEAYRNEDYLIFDGNTSNHKYYKVKYFEIDERTCSYSELKETYYYSKNRPQIDKLYLTIFGDLVELVSLSIIPSIDDLFNNEQISFAKGPFSDCNDYKNYAINKIQSSNIENPNLTKNVIIDAHGEEVVSFAYADGQVLATARSGEGPQKQVTSLIGEQGFVDIHLPKGCEESLNFIGGTSLYKCYDLKTGKELFTDVLPPGVYRIEAVNKDNLYNFTYIDESGNIKSVDPNAKGVTYKVNYYDYSLNYYDDAGNLTSTLPPIGFDSDAYADYNLTGTVRHIKNNLKSHFKYNTLGQLLEISSPDEGAAWFKYRTDGQIRFSQNSKQVLAGEFSYTNYDTKARPIESGVYKENATYSFNGTTSSLDIIIDYSAPYFIYFDDNDALKNTDCSEQHFTLYDVPDPTGLQAAFASDERSDNYEYQAFVAGNVSKTHTENPQTSTTWYSYDIYGRVTWIAQVIDGLEGPKTINYEYDDVTGAVTKVYYQRWVPDEQFIHKYIYDEDDYSLVLVQTSTDDETFTTHANYKYYETGGLKRMELGIEDKDNIDDETYEFLQGVDYVYNINGALKAINHPSLDPTKDPGQDANDVFGMHIDYYKGDYNRSGVHINTSNAGKEQYNGNIKAVRWNNKATDENTEFEKTYAYSYNRNNWLTAATYGENAEGNADGDDIIIKGKDVDDNVSATNSIVITPIEGEVTINPNVTLSIVGFTESATSDYGVSNLTYDANGNIQSLKRNRNTVDDNSNAMDNMKYHYDPLKPNQLNRVEDLVTGKTDAEDIKTQDVNNYEYNSIGQLIKNNEEFYEYEYNASGLVTKVQTNHSSAVEFFYNDRGQRVKKVESGRGFSNTTYYVRDAAGTPMAIYYRTNNAGGNRVSLTEHTVYGASRLGVYKRADATTAYELTDHLGNVRAVIKKETEIYTGTDYYPFGMPMPLRNSLSDYRYAYQGQEKDPETGKEAFELRLWDARIGRWLTTDPAKQHYSPYMAMGNNPINRIDPDGGTDFKLNKTTGEVTQVGDVNNDPDRLLKVDENNEVRFRNNGKPRVQIKNIKKGILTDGSNFKTQNRLLNFSNINEKNQIIDFLVSLSDYLNVELSGFGVSDDTTNFSTKNINGFLLEAYTTNTIDHANTRGLTFNVNAGPLIGGANNLRLNVKNHFHTHPKSNERLGPDAKALNEPSERDKKHKRLTKIPHIIYSIHDPKSF